MLTANVTVPKSASSGWIESFDAAVRLNKEHAIDHERRGSTTTVFVDLLELIATYFVCIEVIAHVGDKDPGDIT